MSEDFKTAASLFSIWWAMVEAQQQLAGEPIGDNAVILYFMGSGASTTVTAKHLRDLVAGLEEQLK